jgi:hypothetical protein
MSERRSFSYRRGDQVTPPPARQTSDVTVMRFDGIYEVDPRLMRRVPQQPFPTWDTLRIAHSREDHLEWMHRHFAETVISGAEILAALPEGQAPD